MTTQSVKKIIKFFRPRRISLGLIIPILVFMLLIAPVFSFAAEPWKGLVPCGTTDNPKPCDFNAFLNMINLIIQFILFNLAIPVSATRFAYAGFLWVTAGG